MAQSSLAAGGPWPRLSSSSMGTTWGKNDVSFPLVEHNQHHAEPQRKGKATSMVGEGRGRGEPYLRCRRRWSAGRLELPGVRRSR